MKTLPMNFLQADEQGRLVLPDTEKNKLSIQPGDKIYFEYSDNGIFLHRPVSQLSKIYVEPTNMCNLECSTCIRHSWTEPAAHMKSEVYGKIISAIESMPVPPTVFFGGFGEPLFHPEIIPMIQAAKEKSCRVELITNGVLLHEDMIYALGTAGLDTLWVSIDGATPETYADVRLGDELPAILKNLQKLRLMKYQYGWKNPILGVSFVLMKRNMGDFSKVVDLSLRTGARKLMVSNVLPYTESMKKEMVYTKNMGQFSHRFHTIHLPRMDKTPETMEGLSSVFSHFEIPEITGTTLSAPYDTCPFIERGSVSVRCDGKVSPCLPLLHDHVSFLGDTRREVESHFVGDLAESGLLDIWNDQEYRKLRERLFGFDFSPCTVCNSCDYPESNVEDCFGSEKPACGGCLWAQGFIQCP